MRRRENYQRRRESRQRGILPPLALQRRREGHTNSGGRGADGGGPGGGTLWSAGRGRSQLIQIQNTIWKPWPKSPCFATP